MEQPVRKASPSTAEKAERTVFDRVNELSRAFDRETAGTRRKEVSPQEVKEAWQTREWRIGDTVVRALGVSHVQETFLEFRPQIDEAIAKSDVVVNEFAPEAQGLYDQKRAASLRDKTSRFNEKYTLEQVRQAYIQSERSSNLGAFHHEVEMVTAKYGKDMAVADLMFAKDAEEFLQFSHSHTKQAEEIDARKDGLKRAGALAGALAVGMGGVGVAVSDPDKRLLSRRKLLGMAAAAAGMAAAGTLPSLIETPPSVAKQFQNELEYIPDGVRMRDAKLAESLQKLAQAGYKNIAFIYGTEHLEGVEGYLADPVKLQRDLARFKGAMEQMNPDPFRVYRLAPGENNSEKPVAAPGKVWQRVVPKK